MWILPRFVLLAALALSTSCRLFQSSEIQRTVSRARHDSSASESINAIHAVLQRAGVEHKIVHFRYDVTARPIEAPMGNYSRSETPLAFMPHRVKSTERTGIIFRDDSDPAHPWWYVDKNNRRWLPNGPTDAQLRFALGRRVEVLRVEEFDRSVSGMAKDQTTDDAPALASIGMKPDWNARFRRLHGTDYNPHSSVDIAKMRRLRER